MALALRKPHAVTIVVQTCIIMLIFRFVGCAAGSCLSYGHSCWGAHGKRSDNQIGSTMHILAAKTSNGSPNNGITTLPKTQWILSRLISGQPVLPLSNKYHIRWSDLAKDKDAYASPKWEYDVAPTDDETIESIRIPINSENNEKKISNAQGIMRNMNEKLGEIPEIILVSPNGYDKPINLRKLNMLELLNQRNRNAK